VLPSIKEPDRTQSVPDGGLGPLNLSDVAVGIGPEFNLMRDEISIRKFHGITVLSALSAKGYAHGDWSNERSRRAFCRPAAGG